MSVSLIFTRLETKFTGRYAGRGVALAGLLLVPFATKLTSLNQTNSGPTRQTQRFELWTAAGATDISGQRAVLPGVAGCKKERVIVPGAGRHQF